MISIKCVGLLITSSEILTLDLPVVSLLIILLVAFRGHIFGAFSVHLPKRNSILTINKSTGKA